MANPASSLTWVLAKPQIIAFKYVRPRVEYCFPYLLSLLLLIAANISVHIGWLPIISAGLSLLPMVP